MWFVAMLVLATFGGDLEDAIPGSDVLEALAICVIIGAVTGAARAPLDVLITRRLRIIHGRDAIDDVASSAVVAPVATVIISFLMWLALWLSGTLLVIPLLFVVLVFALERPLAAGAAMGPGLEDPVLERRLMRFARELGLGEVYVRKTSGSMPSPLRTDPDVLVIRRRVEVPSELADAGGDVLETRLAAAIVSIRRNRYGKQLIRVGVLLATVAVVVLLFEGTLLRVAGSDTVGAPGFAPMALLVCALAISLSSPLAGMYKRAATRREIGDVLDLTRDPDAMLATISDDANRVDHINPLRRLVSGRPFARAATAEVERWRQGRRVTLLFTDIANSTESLNRLGDKRWYEVVSDHDHVVRSVIAEFDGDEIDSAGDGFFVVFADGGRAVLAAMEMQRRLREIEVGPGEPIGVRMGVHVGEAIRRGREVVGREVNLAARIGAVAGPGEVLVSQELRDELAASARFSFGAARAASFKGFSDDHVVYPVVWWTDGSPAAATGA